jgi:DNA-directed RNA polymerase beta' subunit
VKNNRGSKNIKQHYTLHITCANVLKFATSIPLVVVEKQERLNVLCDKYKSMYDIGRYDIIPSVKIGELDGDYHRDELKKVIELTTDEKEADLLKKTIEQQVYFDEIISIEEIEPTHRYVYDFTVEEDRTFLNRDLLCLMDTFHLAGVAGKSVVTTSGVARLTEIINLAKTIKTPSMTIRLKDEYKYSEEKAEQLKESLEYTSIKDIINESQILYEHDDLSVSHSEDMEFIRTYFEFSTLMGLEDMTSTYSKWVLRLMFDRESMLNRNIYMQDIQDAIMNTCDSQGEIQAIFSDDNSGNLVMRISIRHEDGESYLDFLKELEQCIMKITLRGIQGIERVGRVEANQVVYHDDGSHEVKKEWIVDTMGTNLKEVFGHEIVDPYHTITNDFYEIERIFGIEGVRYALMKDLNELVGAGSSYNVNYRHIELLVDTMTYRGIMMPIGRHGINRSADNGPLAKASFEEMTEIFVKAGTYAERDNMQGVSGNIIMGQYAPIGTNAFDVYLDEEMIAEHAPDVDEEDEAEVDAYELEQEIDDMYDDDKIREEDVTDEMFDFGFDFDFNNQYQLGSSQLAPPVLNVDGKIEKIETVEAENTDSDDESIDLSSDDEEVEIDVSETDEAENEEEINVSNDEEEEELHEDAERLEGDTNDEDDAESIDVSDDEEMGDDQEVEAENIYEEDTDAEEEEDEEEIDVSDED